MLLHLFIVVVDCNCNALPIRMDTITIVVIGVGAALVVFCICYVARKRRLSNFDDACRVAIQQEFNSRSRHLDVEIRRIVLSSMEGTFPALDNQSDNDNAPIVRSLINDAEGKIFQRGTQLDAASLHSALYATRSIMNHCSEGTKSCYGSIDALLRSDAGRILSVESGDDPVAVPRSSCVFRLCCVFRGWEMKQFNRLRRSRYYTAAHRLCCGRLGEADDETDATAAVEMQPTVSQCGTLGNVKLFLCSAGPLSRRYVEVTAHAKELVFSEPNGVVRVASSCHMYSQCATEIHLKALFNKPTHDMISFEISDDETHFSGNGLRDDIFAHLFNIHHLMTHARDARPLYCTHEAVLLFDREVKAWCVEVHKKLITRILRRWSQDVLSSSARMISEMDLTRFLPQRPFPDPPPCRTDADFDTEVFWQGAQNELQESLNHKRATSVPDDSIQHCCGYCLPQFAAFEQTYNESPTEVSLLLSNGLKCHVASLHLRSKDALAIKCAVGKIKQRVLRLLLAPSSDDDRTTPTRPESPAEVSLAFPTDEAPRPPTRIDDSPTPPARIDDGYSPRDTCASEAHPDVTLVQLIDAMVRDAFEVVEDAVDALATQLESASSLAYLEHNWPGAVDHVHRVAAEAVHRSSKLIAFRAREVAAMRRVYNATRLLCATGRMLHVAGSTTTMDDVLRILNSVRDALMETRELRRMQLDNGEGASWITLEGKASEDDSDVVSGKKQLLFPWHRVLVAYNFYANLLQKPHITLQFIYS